MNQTADSTLALAQALIGRRSVTPEDAGCQALLAERLRALGFVSHDLSSGDVTNHLFVRGDQGPLLLFLGHTDVVPAEPESVWSSPPFEPAVREGKLYGRGAADMKGSVAAFTTACERVYGALDQVPEAIRIGILLTSDEEGPAQHGIRAAAAHLKAIVGDIDWCLVGEPSSERQLGDTLRIGRRGSLSGVLRVPGRQGHVAYPQLADNPVHKLAPLLSELVSMIWDEGTADFPPTGLQVSAIETDTQAVNVIPGMAIARFNLRYSPALSAEAIVQRIEALTARHAPDATIEWNHSANPFTSPAGALRQAVSDSIVEATGITPLANTAGGTSDGRFIAPLGAEVVEFGPINATIHQIDEYVEVAALSQLSTIYEAIIRRLVAARPD